MNIKKADINILIVDDTPLHIATACHALEPLGYTIRVAASGGAALKQIALQKPTLMLLDVWLEDCSGFEVCSQLKQAQETQDIAIIFMTASSNVEDIQRGFLLGAQDYVVKPYHADELLARVQTHIQLTSQSLNLKAAYQELDSFTHTVAHDLKSPLQVLRQLVHLLDTALGESPSADVRDILSHIDLKSGQLIQMVERLLEYSRVGLLDCHFERVDLHQIFIRQLEEQTSLLPGRRITIHQQKLPKVCGDAGLLELLVQNVVSNALKFTINKAETILTITAAADEHHIKIMVQDNGVGFDMKYLDVLFQVFSRLHGSDFPGSGVGLSICRRIMEHHNGTITLDSVLQKGTLVTLSFRK